MARARGVRHAAELLLNTRRFPIVSGLQVIWDHSKAANQRVKSIHLTLPPEPDDDDNPEDLVDFVEQEDGTTVEVKQRKVVLGDEVKNMAGKMYRIVRVADVVKCSCPDHPTVHGGRVSIRCRASASLITDTTAFQRSRIGNTSSTTRRAK